MLVNIIIASNSRFQASVVECVVNDTKPIGGITTLVQADQAVEASQAANEAIDLKPSLGTAAPDPAEESRHTSAAGNRSQDSFFEELLLLPPPVQRCRSALILDPRMRPVHAARAK